MGKSHFTMTKTRDNDSGFTLLEVLVSFTVLAISLSIILPTISLHTKRTQQIEVKYLAQLKLQNLMSELGKTLPAIEGTQSGIDDTGLKWSVQLTPLGNEDDVRSWNMNAYAVTATTTWEDASRTHSSVLKTVKIFPSAESQ